MIWGGGGINFVDMFLIFRWGEGNTICESIWRVVGLIVTIVTKTYLH